MSVTKFTTAPTTGGDSGSNVLLVLLGLAVAGALAWYLTRDSDPPVATEEAEHQEA